MWSSSVLHDQREDTTVLSSPSCGFQHDPEGINTGGAWHRGDSLSTSKQCHPAVNSTYMLGLVIPIHTLLPFYSST